MINLFTPAEKERIEQAVFEAEARTSAELVPCVTDASGRYEVAIWRGAALAALIGLALALLVIRFYTGWGLAWLHTPWGVSLIMLLGATIGAAVTAASSALRRFLSGARYLDERVHQRAMQAFVEEEVFRTERRTGILIFISLFEHRIEVLGDAGVNAAVEADDWAEIVRHLQQAIRQGRLVDGLAEAISMCGDLLEQSGLAETVEDTNELANRVRLVRYER